MKNGCYFGKRAAGAALAVCAIMASVAVFGDTAFKVDRRFMTNADVPLLAMEGLVEHPVNPFTGQAMTDAVKHRPEHRVLFSENWKEDVAERKTFPEGYWYSLSGDQVLNRDAWTFDKYE